MRRALPLLLICLALSGCTSLSYSTGTAALSRDLVEQKLVRGRTTKAEVIALLGEPRSSSSMSMTGVPNVPAETFIYRKTFHRDRFDQGVTGRAVAQAALSGNQFDRVESSVLIVMFDARGVVMGHSFSQSAHGARR